MSLQTVQRIFLVTSSMVACPYFAASGWWFVELTKLRRSFLAWLVVQTTHKNYHTRHINVHRYIRRRREKYFSKGKKKNHHDSGCSVNLSHPYKLFYTLSLQKEKFLFSRWSHPFSLVVFSYLQFSRNAYCSHYLTSNLRCD